MADSEQKRKRSASRDPTPVDGDDAARPQPPQQPQAPRPVAPPRPQGTEEDLSHGQRPASDAARADRGVPVVAQQQPPPGPAAAPLPKAEPAKLVVPGHSSWFRYYSVHRLEREALPEWFDGRQGGGEGEGAKSPSSYLALRNLLVDSYREDPSRRLTYTEARARAAAAAAAAASPTDGDERRQQHPFGDASSVLRLHSFLDHWGIINFQAPPPSAGEAGAPGSFGPRGYYQRQQQQDQRQASDAGPPASLLARVDGGPASKKKRALPPGSEAVFSFPPASVAAGVAAAGGTGVPPGLAALAGRKDRYGRHLADASDVGLSSARQQRPKPRYFCSAMPWVDCTEARYHCTRVPDVDLSPAAFADGRFPPGCSAKDFVRVDGGAPAPLPGAATAAASAAPVDPGARPPPQSSTATADAAGAWTDAETLALLEGVELFGEDWPEVAQHVGSRSAYACVRKFLALPLADEFLAELEAPSMRRVAAESTVVDVERDEKDDDDVVIPFADAGNPVMAQVAFLSHMVGPRVAAAAASRALEVLTEEEEGGKEGANGAGERGDDKKMRAAAAAALAAAAVKARLLADAEEREVVRLAAQAAAALTRRIEAKVSALDDLERALGAERSAAEAARDAAFAERRAMAFARVEGNGGGGGGVAPAR